MLQKKNTGLSWADGSADVCPYVPLGDLMQGVILKRLWPASARETEPHLQIELAVRKGREFQIFGVVVKKLKIKINDIVYIYI